jgi:hypothetical protein
VRNRKERGVTEFKVRLRVTGFAFWVTDYGLRITDYGSRITDYGSRITSYGFRVGGLDVQGLKRGLGSKFKV